MWWLLDLIVLVILGVTVALGHHRGFLRSAVQLVGLVASVVLAFSFSGGLSEWIFDDFAQEPLKTKVVSVLEENVTSTAEVQTEKILEALPDFLVNTLNAHDTAKEALETLTEKVDQSAEAVAETVVTDIFRPLAVSVLRILLFILLFGVFMLAVKLITKLIKPLTKLPVIHQADGLLGAAVGLVKGILFVLVAVSVMQLMASSGTLVQQQWIDTSLVVSWIVEHNPLASGLSWG